MSQPMKNLKKDQNRDRIPKLDLRVALLQGEQDEKLYIWERLDKDIRARDASLVQTVIRNETLDKFDRNCEAYLGELETLHSYEFQRSEVKRGLVKPSKLLGGTVPEQGQTVSMKMMAIQYESNKKGSSDFLWLNITRKAALDKRYRQICASPDRMNEKLTRKQYRSFLEHRALSNLAANVAHLGDEGIYQAAVDLIKLNKDASTAGKNLWLANYIVTEEIQKCKDRRQLTRLEYKKYILEFLSHQLKLDCGVDVMGCDRRPPSAVIRRLRLLEGRVGQDRGAREGGELFARAGTHSSKRVPKPSGLPLSAPDDKAEMKPKMQLH